MKTLVTQELVDDLNPYERERLENIRKNQEILAQLHIEPIVPKQLVPSKSRKRSRKLQDSKRSLRRDNEEPKRTSLRLKGLSPEGDIIKHEKSINDKENPSSTWDWKRKEGPLAFAFANEVEEQSGASFLRKLFDFQNPENSSEITDRESKTRNILASQEERPIESESLLSEKYREDRYFRKISQLRISENDIGKLTRDRIYSLAFYPDREKLIVFAGDRWGKLGFWDVDEQFIEQGSDEKQRNTMFEMAPHTQAISCMAFPQAYRNRLVSCSYDGSIRLMDVERQTFEELFVHPNESAFCSLCVHANGRVLYYSSKDGTVGRLDLREPSIDSTQLCHVHGIYQLHEKRVNTVDIHPLRDTLMMTASGDRRACLWDTRKLKSKSAEPLVIMEHGGTISSAYFSPQTGTNIVTCSSDNFLRVFNTPTDISLGQSPSVIKIHHDNHTGRWITPFKIVFDPKHEESFIVGNMRRAIDVFSTQFAEYAVVLQNELLSTIPAVNCIHPYLDVWISGNASGRLFVWR